MTVFPPLQTLTEYEMAALRLECNLADGHAKLAPNSDGFTRESLNTLACASMQESESRFVDALARQGSVLPIDSITFFPSASMAIDAVAKLVAQEGRRKVALLEPVFDSLALLLKRAGVDLAPIREDVEDIVEAVGDHDAVFICVPNNPTGWHPEKEFWDRLGRSLRDSDTLLIIDRTFKFLADPDPALDELIENNPLVIAIEDTGKIWSTLECKVSTVVATDRILLEKIREIGAEVTLNVSPISLILCAEAIESDRGAARVTRAIRRNADILIPALRERGISGSTRLSFLLATGFEGPDVNFVEELQKHGLAVLPVSKFYWSQERVDTGSVRISLARPEAYALRAAEIISALPTEIGLTR